MISISSAAAIRNKTTWRVVDKGMDELLNSGWKMMNHGSNRVKTSGYGQNYPYDQETYTFTLYKDGKFILCLIPEPRPDNSYSYCRQLN
jgi:hypothetical protein